MAFTDPQTVTISGVTTSLPSVSHGQNSSAYSSADQSLVLQASHQYGRRIRRAVAFVHKKVAPDPLFPTQNAPYSLTFRITADVPTTGYTVAEQQAIWAGFVAQVNAGSPTLMTRLLGGEN